MATNANQSVYYLYGFNSYSDRRCIKYDTLADYLALSGISYDIQATTNFCEGDGVVRPNVTYRKSASMPKGTPNYVIVVDSLGTIQSRWYVVDSLNKNVSTYNLTLKRDSVADFYDHIISAPTFIEKATVPTTSKLIFNDEGLSVNQIKTREDKLRDESGCAWIVGYMDTGTIKPKDDSWNISYQPAIPVDRVFTTKSDFTTNFEERTHCKFPSGTSSLPTTVGSYQISLIDYWVGMAYYNVSMTNKVRYLSYNWKPNKTVTDNSPKGFASLADLQADTSTYGANIVKSNAYSKSMSSVITETLFSDQVAEALNNNRTAVQSQIKAASPSYDFNVFDEYDGQIFAIEGAYYKCSVKRKTGSSITGYQPIYLGSNTSTAITAALAAANWDSYTESASASAVALVRGEEIYLDFEEYNANEVHATMSDNSIQLNNLPYRMFAIPYNTDGVNVNIYQSDGVTGYCNISPQNALMIANMLSSTYSGANKLYDLQLLPYCPIRNLIVRSNGIKLPTSPNEYTDVKDQSDNKVGVIFWCSTNSFTFDISYSIGTSNVKLETICDMYRLCSPNWNGQFEFSPAKNGGVTKFNIDCTYKPHIPYIHINPDFGELYGSDFDDARGLICAGDFSLPQVSNAWSTYELQNKNYQNQFQRQIDNMEITHNIEREQLIWKTVAGSLQGGATGAAMGAMAGGLPGAVAAGVLGTGASLAGGIRDIQLNEKAYGEQTSYATDIHNMQLDNIKAMGNNLTNAGAITNNNKIYPIVEYYTCSAEEREAVTNYLYWYGMTVNIVGTIQDYLWDDYTFISGQIMRLTIDEENHMVNDIRNEIKKGVFIK